MDALSDPRWPAVGGQVVAVEFVWRAFMNAQEKRAEQLKSLGIEEAEISTNVIQSTGGEQLFSDKI